MGKNGYRISADIRKADCFDIAAFHCTVATCHGTHYWLFPFGFLIPLFVQFLLSFYRFHLVYNNSHPVPLAPSPSLIQSLPSPQIEIIFLFLNNSQQSAITKSANPTGDRSRVTTVLYKCLCGSKTLGVNAPLGLIEKKDFSEL